MYRDWFDRMDETMRKPAAKQRHDVAPCASMGIGVERPILVFSVLHRRRTAAMKDGKNGTDIGHRQPWANAQGYILSPLRGWLHVVQYQLLTGRIFYDSRAVVTRPMNKACLFLDVTFLVGRVLSRWLWKTDAEV